MTTKLFFHRIFSACIRLMLVLMIAGICLMPERVTADSGKTVDLTLVAWGDSLTGIGGNQGHAFLIITNNSSETLSFCGYPIYPGTSITVSIWPDSNGLGGVYINREMYTGADQTCTACTISITPGQLAEIAAATPAESYYHDGQNDEKIDLHDDIFHNCTTYSVMMWNKVADEDHQIEDDFMGIDAPKWLSKKLANFPECKYFDFPKGQIQHKDMYYLSSDGELIPREIEVPKLTADLEGETHVRMVWYPEFVEFLNGQKSVNAYGVVYYNTSTPSDVVEKTIADSTSYTTPSLEPGYTYGFQVAAAFLAKNPEHSFRSEYSDPVTVTVFGDLKEAAVTIKKESYSYTGLPISPKPTVVFRGRTLTKDKDYTVSYTNNQFAGTATITLSGIGNFKGTVTKTFKITPVWGLSPTSMTLLEGDSQKIGVTVAGFKTNAEAQNFVKKILWTSRNSRIASVAGGKVTAGKKGSTTITATAEGKSKTCKVTVKKKDYKSLYKAFLEKGTYRVKSGNYPYDLTLTSYQILDINQDKTPELIVKSSEPSVGPAFDEHYVFTIRNKKVAFCESYMKRGEASIQYSKKYKAVRNSGWTNFVGGTWYHLFQLKNNKKIVQYKYVWEGYADQENTKYVYYIGDSDAKAKQVSKAKYTAFLKKYFNKKLFKTYKFLKNTAQNRNKTFGK